MILRACSTSVGARHDALQGRTLTGINQRLAIEAEIAPLFAFGSDTAAFWRSL